MSQEEDIEVFPPCPDEDNPAEVEWEFITSGNLSYLFSSSWFSFFSFHCFLGKSKYPILTTHGGFFKYGINRTNIDTGRTWYACSHKRSHKCRATVLTRVYPSNKQKQNWKIDTSLVVIAAQNLFSSLYKLGVNFLWIREI